MVNEEQRAREVLARFSQAYCGITRDQAIAAMLAFAADRPAIEGDAVREAAKFMRHDGLCAFIGGYGYCSCGMETAKAALDLNSLSRSGGGGE